MTPAQVNLKNGGRYVGQHAAAVSERKLKELDIMVVPGRVRCEKMLGYRLALESACLLDREHRPSGISGLGFRQRMVMHALGKHWRARSAKSKIMPQSPWMQDATGRKENNVRLQQEAQDTWAC